MPLLECLTVSIYKTLEKYKLIIYDDKLNTMHSIGHSRK